MLDTIDLTIIGFAVPSLSASWHLKPYNFAPVIVAGVIAGALGSFVLGTAADWIGRKPTVIAGVLLFSVFTLLTPTATSLQSLAIYRFLIGLGLGGMVPNAMAIAGEYSPTRIREQAVSFAACGLPMGSMAAAVISFLLIPAFGWKSVFYVGGIVPLVIVPFLIWYFPESIRFLALKKKNSAQIARILRAISPSSNFSAENQFVLNEQRASRSTISSLFTEGRAPVTLLLFAIFFICLLEMYFFNQWLPSLLQQSGIPMKRAFFVAAIFGVGGVIGGFVGGWFSKRLDSCRVLGSIFVGTCISVIALSLSHGHPLVIMVVAFFAGFFTNGATVVEMAVAASVYPTAIRGTGLGWALGVGRIGTIVGPTLAGILLAMGIAIPKLFLLSAIPVAIGAVAAFVLTGIRRRQAATPPTVAAAVLSGR